MGAKVVTLSDSAGYIYDPEGIDSEKLAYVMHLKNVRRGRIKLNMLMNTGHNISKEKHHGLYPM
jgi:glutamate dehydrogenase/leucine dehydrogenase